MSPALCRILTTAANRQQHIRIRLSRSHSQSLESGVITAELHLGSTVRTHGPTISAAKLYLSLELANFYPGQVKVGSVFYGTCARWDRVNDVSSETKGVNWVDYYPHSDKPYLLTTSDDRTVKIFDYTTKVSGFALLCFMCQARANHATGAHRNARRSLIERVM